MQNNGICFLIYINCGYVGGQNDADGSLLQASDGTEQSCEELSFCDETGCKVHMFICSDCTFMQTKCHSLISNMFLHNIRELLENAEVGEEGSSLAEVVELSLLNQSKLTARIILRQDDLNIRIGN